MQILTTAARCNSATISPAGGDSDSWQVIGDPTEGALVVAALKAGIDANDSTRHVLFEIPFDSERKAMSVVIRGSDGSRTMHSNGAPEVILAKCNHERCHGQSEPLNDDRRRKIMQQNSEMASRALRVLALACRDHSQANGTEYDETNLTFLGLIGMIDPPRDEVKVAIGIARKAGIRPVMITGDHAETALAIARELHIAADTDQAVSGQELDQLTDEQLAADVDKISVYARVSAEHKLRVVRA